MLLSLMNCDPLPGPLHSKVHEWGRELRRVWWGEEPGQCGMAAASVRQDLAEVIQCTHARGQKVKAIFENCYLSDAQKKRLELARALAARPYLLLLDEVLAGLNPTEIALMVETIRRIRDDGVTILMIEHVMQAVMNVSDRVLVLDYGILIAEGHPQEVANNPKVIEAYLGNPKLAQKLFADEAGR